MSLQYDPALSPCPICGKAAAVIHMYDSYDRADFGWDAGCAAACRGDGVHGLSWDDESTIDFPHVRRLLCKQEAIDAWNRWVENWKERHNEA